MSNTELNNEIEFITCQEAHQRGTEKHDEHEVVNGVVQSCRFTHEKIAAQHWYVDGVEVSEEEWTAAQEVG